MLKDAELTRLKIAADVLADFDRRTLLRDEAEQLEDIEDRLLALASCLFTRLESAIGSGLRGATGLHH